MIVFPAGYSKLNSEFEKEGAQVESLQLRMAPTDILSLSADRGFHGYRICSQGGKEENENSKQSRIYSYRRGRMHPLNSEVSRDSM